MLNQTISIRERPLPESTLSVPCAGILLVNFEAETPTMKLSLQSSGTYDPETSYIDSIEKQNKWLYQLPQLLIFHLYISGGYQK